MTPSSEKERGTFPRHHVPFISSRYGGCWNKKVTSFPDEEIQVLAWRGRGRQGHGRQGHGSRDTGDRDTGGRDSVTTRTECSHGIHECPNQRDYVHPSWLSLVPLPLLLHFRIRGLWWVWMCGNFLLPHNEPGRESTGSVIFAAHFVQ